MRIEVCGGEYVQDWIKDIMKKDNNRCDGDVHECERLDHNAVC